MQLVLLFVHCVDCVQVLWQVFQGTAGAVGVHGSIDVAALCEALTASKDLQHLLDLGSGVVGTELQQSFAAAVQQVLARREPPSSWHTFMQVRSAMLSAERPLYWQHELWAVTQSPHQLLHSRLAKSCLPTETLCLPASALKVRLPAGRWCGCPALPE